MPNNQTEYEIMHVKTSLSNAAQKPRTLREFLVQAEFCCSAGGALSMINEVIIGENHWGSNPGAYLITNFLPYVSLPFPTPTLHHFTQKNRNVAQSTLSENFYLCLFFKILRLLNLFMANNCRINHNVPVNNHPISLIITLQSGPHQELVNKQ